MTVQGRQELQDIFIESEALLLLKDPVVKAEKTITLHETWCAMPDGDRLAATADHSATEIRRLQEAGRPAKPQLLEPSRLARRGLGSLAGRVALLHSLAHIEFNAINLALDAVYRFRQVPLAYIDDWLKVASDEGKHFMLLHNRLHELDCSYGDLPAHDGLWEMARRTDHDILVRMALVPRILEARGLDVAPPMIGKLVQQGDTASAAILQRIYTDEITHVEVGNRWFRFVCEQRSLDGVEVFRDLLRGENSGYLRGPFNDEARIQAGFTTDEMAVIRQMEQEYRERDNRGQLA